ncbi:MAG: alpha/beta hydrolase [Candidatus Thorarchaeota archaeon]
MKLFDRLILILLIISGIFILNYVGEAGLDQIRSKISVNNDSKTNFNLNVDSVPDFWNVSEILSENLSITLIGSNIQNNINVSNYYFDSGVYNNSIIRIFCQTRFLSNTTGKLPVLILIHGFGGNHTQTIPFMNYFTSLNYLTVSIDLPGFDGLSTGFPLITPETLNIGSSNPKISPFYILEKAVLRTIYFSKTLGNANTSEIFLGGASLGGILTIYASALDNSLSGAAVFLASGDFANAINYGGLMNAFFPKDKYPSPLENKDIQAFFQLFDPLIYSSNARIPIYYSIGTDDEFFSMEAANETYNSFPTEKTLNFIPRLHHNLSVDLMGKSVELWINSTLYKNIQLPVFNITQIKKSTILSDQLEITSSINTSLPIKSMKLHYKEKYMGNEWKTVNLENIRTIENVSIAFYILDSPITSVPLEWFITVELENGAQYSSYLYETTLSNIFFIPWMALLGIILVLPIVVQFYIKYRRIVRKGINKETKNHIFLIASEYLTIIAIQALFIYSVY